MATQHLYSARLLWTGDRGGGTTGYKDYDRTWEIQTQDKKVIQCSNDPLLGGDPTKHNPEDLLLSSLSACHMLWYLHLASEAGIIVRAYEDCPVGVGESDANGAGRFIRATLRPTIKVHRGTDLAAADLLHAKIDKVCFIARSVAFPVFHEARYVEV